MCAGSEHTLRDSLPSSLWLCSAAEVRNTVRALLAESDPLFLNKRVCCVFFSWFLLQLTSHHVVHQALIVGLFTRLSLRFHAHSVTVSVWRRLGVKERSGTGRSGRKMQQRFGCLIKSQQLAGQAAFIKVVVLCVQSLGLRKRRLAGLKCPVKSFRETKTTP